MSDNLELIAEEKRVPKDVASESFYTKPLKKVKTQEEKDAKKARAAARKAKIFSQSLRSLSSEPTERNLEREERNRAEYEAAIAPVEVVRPDVASVPFYSPVVTNEKTREKRAKAKALAALASGVVLGENHTINMLEMLDEDIIIDVDNLTWVSSDPLVVSLTPNAGTATCVALGAGEGVSTITVTDNTNKISGKAVIQVTEKVPLTSVTLSYSTTAADVGTAFNSGNPTVTLTPANATGVSKTFSITSGGTLGLTVNSTTGVVTGTPTAAGSVVVQVSATDDSGSSAKTATATITITT